MAIEKTDVVIVGMGAVGGILAAELGKAGMKVIGLERGPRLTTADFSGQDELRYFQRQDLRPNAKRQPVTWRPNANMPAKPLPILNYGNQAGAGTVHYSAVSWRVHEGDLRVHSTSRIDASSVPTVDPTGKITFMLNTRCFRATSDNSGPMTGVSYYRTDYSSNTIEVELVSLAPFIYDNTPLLLLSKTRKFP